MDFAILEQWYARYGFAVHRRCLRFLSDQAEADDALQEVFMRVQKYGAPQQELADPLGWLYRVADNHCFDVLKRRRRFVGPTENDAALAVHQERPDAAANPDRVRLVAQILAACKPRERDAATLYFVDELTQDEVAASLGVSRKTVKEKLHRFREVAARLLDLSAPAEETA